MRRALFGHEFLSALVPNLATVGAILGSLTLFERLYVYRLLGFPGDVDSFGSLVLLVGLVAFGFIAGERCFSSAMKEHRMLFLASLPIPRNRVWMAIVSARLLAALISLVAVVAIRWILPWVQKSKGMSPVAIPVEVFFGPLYLPLFSAGTCFALLFRRPLVVLAVGGPLFGLVLVELLAASSYGIQRYAPSVLASPPRVLSGWHAIVFLSASLALLSILFFSLSRWLFVRGEVGDLRRRTKNQILSGIALVAYITFILSVSASARLSSIYNTWVVSDCKVSPDGRYMAVFEALKDSPFVRASIIETHIGRQRFQATYDGAGWIFWSSEKDILNLLILDNSPLTRLGYLIPGAVRWVRLTPEARVISTSSFRGVSALEVLAAGQAVLALQEGNQGRVVRLEGASGLVSEVVRAPSDGPVEIHGDGTGTPAALVFFKNVILPKKAWVVKDASAYEVAAPRSLEENSHCLFGEIPGSDEGMQTVLRRKVGPPSSAEGKPLAGNFLLPRDFSWILPPGVSPKSLFFLADSSNTKILWARSASDGKWERLVELAPEPSYQIENGRIIQPRLVAIDFGSGSGAFLAKEGAARRLVVYVHQAGMTQGPEACSLGEEAILRIPGLDGILIHLLCGAKPARSVFFVHLSGSQKISELAGVRPGSVPLYLTSEEWGVWRSPEGKIWRSSPDGSEFPLWPLGTDRGELEQPLRPER
jgi:hypothetical protein